MNHLVTSFLARDRLGPEAAAFVEVGDDFQIANVAEPTFQSAPALPPAPTKPGERP